MLNKSLPQGLFQPLEEGDRQDQVWTPQMRLTKDSPSWMWKKQGCTWPLLMEETKQGGKKVLGAPPRQERKKEWASPQKIALTGKNGMKKRSGRRRGGGGTLGRRGGYGGERMRRRRTLEIGTEALSGSEAPPTGGGTMPTGAEAAPAAGATLEIGAGAAPAAGATLETGDPEASPKGPPWSGKKGAGQDQGGRAIFQHWPRPRTLEKGRETGDCHG